VATGVAVAVMSLVRPSDATYVAVPLLVALVVIGSVHRTRRIRAALAVAIGLAVGWGFWIVEAFVNFGGPLKRLQDANLQDGGGLHWNLPFFTHVISGPVACCIAVNEPFAVGAWWWLIWPVAVLGVVLASGAARRAYLLCLVCAATVFAQYLFLIKVEAPGPRILLPVYGLLSLPIASVVTTAVARWRHSLVGGLAIAGLVLGFSGHVVAQQHVLRANVRQQRTRQAVPRLVAAQLRSVGVGPPCILAGPQLPEIAYQTGCHELTTLPSAEQIAKARQNGTRLAVLLWSDDEIDKFKAEYDTLVGVTPRVLPREDGRVSYLYELTP
jgi:hypothetical protein